MQISKEENTWLVTVEESDNHLGLVNMLRYLENLNTEIGQENIEGLVLELNLAQLERANSELIAQFVMLQSTLVRSNGRLRIVDANVELKGAFDVVMLDKIISITYQGLEEGEDGDLDDE